MMNLLADFILGVTTERDSSVGNNLSSSGLPNLQQLFSKFHFSPKKDSLFCYIPSHGLLLFSGLDISSIPENEKEQPDIKYRYVSRMNLTHFPCHNVDKVGITENGAFLSLEGPYGITVVSLPPDVGSSSLKAGDLKGEYLCRSFSICSDVFRLSQDVRRVKCRWHPGSSFSESFIAVLFSDSTLRIFKVTHNSYETFSVINLSDSSNALSDGKSKISLADTVVSFDFGEARETASDISWPVYILHDTGEVYCLLTSVKHNRCSQIVGPLTMYPPAEVDYGIDSCNLLFLSAPLPVLVIATSYGILYNCILLPDKDCAEEDLNPEKRVCLYVYESVELELGLATSDLKTGEQTEDNISTHIDLISDVQVPSRYYAVHSSGVHSVNLGWIHDMQRVESMDFQACPVADLPASVQYLLSTGSFGGRENAAVGIRGFAPFWATGPGGAFAVVLLWDFSLTAVPLKWLKECEFLLGEDKERIGTDSKADGDSSYFIDHIKRALQTNASVPILKSQKRDISEKEAAELFLRSIQILEQEYVRKLEAARDLCDSRVTKLKAQKEHEQSELELSKMKIEEVQNRLESAEQSYVCLAEKQKELNERLAVVNAALHRASGTSSEAEERLADKLALIDTACCSIRERLERDRVAVLGANKGEIGVKYQLDSMRNVLETQNEELESLMRRFKRVDSELRTVQS